MNKWKGQKWHHSLIVSQGLCCHNKILIQNTEKHCQICIRFGRPNCPPPSAHSLNSLIYQKVLEHMLFLLDLLQPFVRFVHQSLGFAQRFGGGDEKPRVEGAEQIGGEQSAERSWSGKAIKESKMILKCFLNWSKVTQKTFPPPPEKTHFARRALFAATI